MNLTLKQLRCVEAVARLRSFAAAGNELCLSPATISVAVAEAEDQIGLPLFQRTTRSVRVTPLGELALPKIRTLLEAYSSLAEELGETISRRTGHVVIGCLASMATRVIPRVLSQCSQRFPDISIELRDGNGATLCDDLLAGRTDLALGSQFEDRPGLTYRPLLEDRFAIMGRTDMVTSANRVALPLRSLRDKPFIAMSRETGIRRSLESQLGPLEHHFSVKYEVSQLASVLGLVEEGIGWSLIPQLALSPFVSQAVSIIYPKNPVLVRSLGIVQRADRPLSPAALAVVQTIVELNQTTQFFPPPRPSK